jgi:hypothetical protein
VSSKLRHLIEANNGPRMAIDTLDHAKIRSSAPDCKRESRVSYRDQILEMQEDARKSDVLIPAVIDLLKTRIEQNDKLVLPPGKTFVTNISVQDFLGREFGSFCRHSAEVSLGCCDSWVAAAMFHTRAVPSNFIFSCLERLAMAWTSHEPRGACRPTISLAGIVKYSNASPCCYAVALIWLERQKRKNGGTEKQLLTSATYQRVILTGEQCPFALAPMYYTCMLVSRHFESFLFHGTLSQSLAFFKASKVRLLGFFLTCNCPHSHHVCCQVPRRLLLQQQALGPNR